jgi:hypothetical protein
MAKYLETQIKLSNCGSLQSMLPEPCNGLMVLIDKGSNGKLSIRATPVHIQDDNCPMWNMFQAKSIIIYDNEKVNKVTDKLLETAKESLYPQLIKSLEEKGAIIEPNQAINWVTKRE